jgi:hypothetical protein
MYYEFGKRQPTMKIKSQPTLEVLATAVAAYEHNNRSIIRHPITIEGVDYVSNRQLITDYLAGNGGPFVVNDIHRKQAEGIVQYLEHTVVLQSLKAKHGAPDRFLGQISAILSNRETNIKEFGIIAWAPHLTDQYYRKDQAREISARYESSSKYIGRLGEKIKIDFTLIEKRYIKSMDCYAVYGFSGDSLVFYWAKNSDKICEVGQIQGRVKSQKEDGYRNNARVTTLNYVKVL